MNLKITDERLEQLSQNIGREVARIRDKIDAKEKEVKALHGEWDKLKSYCPHAITKHHVRLTAEDDAYDVCEICGATL